MSVIPFTGVVQRAYIKLIPQKKTTDTQTGNLNSLQTLAAAIVPEYDSSRFVIDVVNVEEHNAEYAIPTRPIEDGSEISDQVASLPKRLTLDILITDTPVDGLDPFFGRVDSGKGRGNDLYDKLEKIADGGEIMTVVAGLKPRKNMAIESLTPTRDNGGYRILVRAVFKEMLLVSPSNAKAVSFVDVSPDADVEHSITPGQAFGLVANLAIATGSV